MNFKALQKQSSGFTLLELLVVIAVVALLTAVIAVNALQSGQQSRDAKRQADIKALQSAVELYKNKNGRYPEACRGANQWSGQQGTSYACGSGNTQYIVGLAPEFISVLPFEQKLNGLNSGYVYRTNVDRTVYKIMAMNTVEADTGLIPDNPSDFSPYLHPLKSCDVRARVNSDGSVSELTDAWCRTTVRDIGYGANNVVQHCRNTNERFQQSYGAWGGFAASTGAGAANTVQAWTQVVICQ
jgi:prepilin-type N-terminal cleavage/methylation domain-containing protein